MSIDLEPLILEQLEQLVPRPGTAGLDWSEVEALARVPRPRRRRVLAAVLLLAVVFVAVALARSLGGFSGWLTGEPGNPASTAEQRAFDRSIRSWSGFPQGTQLRRLDQVRVGGASYVLHGFRGAGSLCLRLTVTGGQSASELACPPLSQLRQNTAPAIVVVAGYGVGQGKPVPGLPLPFYGARPAALVTLGIVADGVQQVEIGYSNGATSRALVAGDAFLAVTTNPRAGETVTHITAQAGGSRVAIPFVVPPTPFSWPKTAPALFAHGPTRVERVVHGGTISWLARREPIGEPVPKNVHDIVGVSKTVAFAREIAPNPAAPERMVVSALPTPAHAFGGHLLDKHEVCAEIVGGRYKGGGCWAADRLFSAAPFSWSTTTNASEQYVTLAGLASDEVARLSLYLGDGQSEPVPLHDNGYLIETPAVDYPLRLVAYDNQNRSIGIVTLRGDVPPTGLKPPARPAANAHWHQIIKSSAGTISIAPSASGGSCYAIAYAAHGGAGGGTLSCPQPLPGNGLNLGLSWSPHHGTTATVRAGKKIAIVVLHFKNGHSQAVRIVDGTALAALPSGDIVPRGVFRGIISLTGLDTHGHLVATQNVLGLIGGAGTIRKLNTHSITIGKALCRITQASPSLTGYQPGARVQYLCHAGILTLIGHTLPGHSWRSRTTLIRGPITALNSTRITIRDTITESPSGSAQTQSCKLSTSSPPTRAYHAHEPVQAYCAGDALTGINRITIG